MEYAYRYGDEYPNGVIWLTADQDIDAQLVDLAMRARWVAPESEHKFKLEIARHRLRNFSRCLIVFDNLEQISAIESYLPEPPAEPHILATSRTEQPDFTFVPIDVLDPDQALRLLIQEAGHRPASDAEWETAGQIATTLGGLPLALELAGAYLSRRPVGWYDYLQLLQQNLKKALPHRLWRKRSSSARVFTTRSFTMPSPCKQRCARCARRTGSSSLWRTTTKRSRSLPSSGWPEAGEPNNQACSG